MNKLTDSELKPNPGASNVMQAHVCVLAKAVEESMAQSISKTDINKEAEPFFPQKEFEILKKQFETFINKKKSIKELLEQKKNPTLFSGSNSKAQTSPSVSNASSSSNKYMGMRPGFLNSQT